MPNNVFIPKDAFCAFYHGTNGIKGHADLKKLKSNKRGAIADDFLIAARGIANLVVGQYYMMK